LFNETDAKVLSVTESTGLKPYDFCQGFNIYFIALQTINPIFFLISMTFLRL